MNIRPSALAGRWYPNKPDELRESIRGYLDGAKSFKLNHVRAIVVPHAGHYWSGPTAAAAYNVLDPDKIRRIFIFCPNHRMPVSGAVSVSADAFETPLGNLIVDQNTVRAWEAAGHIRIDDAAHKLEHAIEIQLPFIQVIFGDKQPQIVPIIVGEMSTAAIQKFAARLKKDLRDDDLVLISSDFLHYGENYDFVPFGAPVQPQIQAYDARTVAAIAKLDSAEFEAFARENPHAACGINSLRLMSAIFENTGLMAHQLAYDTSGRRSNDDSMSVSYVAMAIADKAQAQSEPKSPVSAAAQVTAHEIVKRALQEAVSKQTTTPVPDDLDLGPEPAVFGESYGVFVTLNEPDGQLRGCIGNIVPVDKLARSLWGRAQDAALNDPRFDPVTPDELPGLKIEISVLTPMEPIGGPDDIVIGKHGVVMRKYMRSAVFLPQVAPEQGWNVEQMLTHLSMKAGLPPQAWREGATFSVFEAQVF
ncbi:MAG: AmmeMemoRadiSam system protein B [Proteobacteria bacterium]|nr:AmmeMemoRadiSam system protein B [Pseudomonadota bacterium]